MTNKVNLIFKSVLIVYCISWIIINALSPAFAYFYFQKEYKKLASECALAMDNSWYLRQESFYDKGSEVTEMLVCHDYDKMRKVMISLGLAESVLAYLGLEALEIGQISAELLVEQHRLKER